MRISHKPLNARERNAIAGKREPTETRPIIVAGGLIVDSLLFFQKCDEWEENEGTKIFWPNLQHHHKGREDHFFPFVTSIVNENTYRLLHPASCRTSVESQNAEQVEWFCLSCVCFFFLGPFWWRMFIEYIGWSDGAWRRWLEAVVGKGMLLIVVVVGSIVSFLVRFPVFRKIQMLGSQIHPTLVCFQIKIPVTFVFTTTNVEICKVNDEYYNLLDRFADWLFCFRLLVFSKRLLLNKCNLLWFCFQFKTPVTFVFTTTNIEICKVNHEYYNLLGCFADWLFCFRLLDFSKRLTVFVFE